MNVRIAEPNILWFSFSAFFHHFSPLPKEYFRYFPPVPTPQALEWPDAELQTLSLGHPFCRTSNPISAVLATLAGAGPVCACCHLHFRDSAVGGCLALSGGIWVWELFLPPVCCSNGDFWAPGVQRRCKNLSVTGQRN